MWNEAIICYKGTRIEVDREICCTVYGSDISPLLLNFNATVFSYVQWMIDYDDDGDDQRAQCKW